MSQSAQDPDRRLGLPLRIRACLFDMDGVIAATETLHARAWAEAFDAFLSRRAAETGTAMVPFDPSTDYDRYVDGKPRADGVRSFLASRDIVLDEGDDDDPASAPTVHGVGNAKNAILLAIIRREGASLEPGARQYVEAVRDAGLSTALVTSSANATTVLAAAGIERLFDVCVDGLVAARLHLAGKPAPDTFAAAAELLGVDASQSAVFEDSLAGVRAGRDGGFGFVVGITRGSDRGADLAENGAQLVVAGLGDLLPADQARPSTP